MFVRIPILVGFILVLQYDCRASAGQVTDYQLSAIMQQIWNSDVNGLQVGRDLYINLQSRTTYFTTRDQASYKFFTSVPNLSKKSTYKKFMALQDNYLLDIAKPDKATSSEKLEQRTFINSILGTPIWQKAYAFITQNKLVSGNVSDYLLKIWFTEYSRISDVRGSSGFEHVFVGETGKKPEISGLHNWVEFMKQETAGNVNYMGYANADKTSRIYELKISYKNIQNPSIKSMFVGTSPEFEMAVYTICFLVRRDQTCTFKIDNRTVRIQTYSMQNYIGTAYPLLR